MKGSKEKERKQSKGKKAKKKKAKQGKKDKDARNRNTTYPVDFGLTDRERKGGTKDNERMNK